MPRNWIEITATGPRKKKDEAAHLLICAGSPGILEDEKSDEINSLVLFSRWEDETREEESKGGLAAFKAYLPADKRDKLGGIEKALGKLGWNLGAGEFKDQDWSSKWKAGLKPIRVTSRGVSIVVKPTWKKASKRPGDIIIEIDPGMAFGTGGHATTKMCLKAILDVIKGGKVVLSRSSILDVGTGTGVLAIAARKLKVRKALGIDIDKVALTVARKNARHNRAEVRISGAAVENVKGRFSIVAANILAGELIRLSPAIRERVSPGGYLVLSGILCEEAESVKEAYSKKGLRFVKAYSTREWSALLFQGPPERPSGR